MLHSQHILLFNSWLKVWLNLNLHLYVVLQVLIFFFFFLYFRFTWLPLHSSRDLHVYGEAASVFLSWCNAGKITLCYTLSWGPSEWLKDSKTQIPTCTKKNHVHSHSENFRKTFAGNVNSLSSPIYFSLIVWNCSPSCLQKDQCFFSGLHWVELHFKVVFRGIYMLYLMVLTHH